jgi:hypothetical protein
MMLDATQNYAAPLTQERLFPWQAALYRAATHSCFKRHLA